MNLCRVLLTPQCCSAALAIIGCAGALAQDSGLGRALPGASLVTDTVQAQARDKLDFVGQKTFTEDQLVAPLAEEVRDLSESGVTPARGDDLAFYVGSFYRKAGFSQVVVDYEIRGGKIFIKIKEGPRSLLRKITFRGNAAVPSATLYEYMIGGTPERLEKEPDQFPYTAAEISAGADRVRGYYLSQGYLKATVEPAGVKLTQSGTRAEVSIRIVEGRRFTIGEIRFTGGTLYPREQLIPALVEPVNGPFAPGIAQAMARNLQSFYKARGHYQTEVAPTADPALARDGRVPITFRVVPGPRFRIGAVTVKNETARPRLRPDFLPKRFAHLRGEIYDPEKLDETFREMLRTGLFENLRLGITPVAGNELRLDLLATEAKAKELGFTLGAGSYEGASVGVRLGDRNIFGSGRPLTFAADYSQRGLRGELLYVDPWLLDSRFALRARLYSEAREEDGYEKNAFGLRFDLSRKAVRHLEFGIFLDGSKVKVTPTTIEPQLLGPLNYQLTTIGITQTTDYRNDPINPARGFVFTTSLELAAIDSESAFTRSIARFSYYLPMGKSLLALGARVGYIGPIIEDLPIDVRFFNGGATTVRSFAERQLGPKDERGDPLGGYLLTVLNAEYIFPITGGLQGAVFVDAGSVKNDDISGGDEMRYAVGLGLRYKLPIGPLRLDYGVNPNPREDEEFGAFHFSFGFAF